MTSTGPLRVLLVDDHAVVREGYRRLLERAEGITVVGEAGTASDGYQAFCRLAPDVVVMDISLPDVSGIEAMRRILAREPAARVLVFSMHEEAIFPTRAFQAGAKGYITKASAPEALVDAVRTVAQDKTYLSHDVAQTLALRNVTGHDAGLSVLSGREFEIMRLLVSGHTVSSIAAKLGLGYKTVANYQSSIRHKLGAQNATQLLDIAARTGLLTQEAAPGPETSGPGAGQRTLE
jgi:two-component system invasion response regulator UvrY